MTAVLATPFITISRNLYSHRAAQGVIYADQLKDCGRPVTVNMTLDLYHPNFNEFDELYVYHGNDWGGHLNLFGGLTDFPYVDNFVNFSQFKGKVYSLVIEHPDYYDMLHHKIKLINEKGKKKADPLWDKVDWDNLQRMIKTSEVVDPDLLMRKAGSTKLAIGDSHAICMYRPSWRVSSTPFKTLWGVLNAGINTFVPESPDNKFEWPHITEIELYFGNIDIRHHLLRQPDPEEATRQLVRRYFDQAAAFDCDVVIYEPLPIETEDRVIPKTGWYEGTPFYGSWAERREIRRIFVEEAENIATEHVKLYRWTGFLENIKGELDTKYMERGRSVHLSREYYPHWQGLEYNRQAPTPVEGGLF